jgi:hypothetical protein
LEYLEHVQKQDLNVVRNGIGADLKRIWVAAAVTAIQTPFEFVPHVLPNYRQGGYPVEEVSFTHSAKVVPTLRVLPPKVHSLRLIIERAKVVRVHVRVKDVDSCQPDMTIAERYNSSS